MLQHHGMDARIKSGHDEDGGIANKRRIASTSLAIFGTWLTPRYRDRFLSLNGERGARRAVPISRKSLPPRPPRLARALLALLLAFILIAARADLVAADRAVRV